MDLTTSSIALLVNVLVLMSVHNGLSQKTDTERTFPRIVLSNLQFFEYTSLNVSCEGFFNDMIKWRVLRSIATGEKTSCNKNGTDSGACHIEMLYPADSGAYWCESEDRRRSESVHIIVTAADVILESPVRPVMFGENVTLRCLDKNKKASKFDFYKDGDFVHSSSTGEMTLHHISVSDQGRYKCKISENEFSVENLLQVKAVFLECPDQPVMEGKNVTLFCTDKMAASRYTSFFYKDDKMIGKSSTGEFTLNKVSKSDEGVYKCRTSEDRESEEQWLAVRENSSITSASNGSGISPSKALFVTALVVLPLLLLLLGLIFKKYKGKFNCSLGSGQQAEEQHQGAAVYSLIDHVNVNAYGRNATEATVYSAVNKAKKTRNCGPSNNAEQALYSTVDKKKKNPGLTSETTTYTTVKKDKRKKPGNSRGAGMAPEETLYSLIR